MADVTFARNSTTQDMILKHYTSININSGDTVTVERAGDVIPHVISVDKTKRVPNSIKYIFYLY